MNAQSKQPRNPCGQGVPIRFQRCLETNEQIKQQNPPLQGLGVHKQNDHESDDLASYFGQRSQSIQYNFRTIRPLNPNQTDGQNDHRTNESWTKVKQNVSNSERPVSVAIGRTRPKRKTNKTT
jgi:hypothetical protein